MDRSEVVSHVGSMEQLARIFRCVSEDGQSRGMRVFEVDNGAGLCFSVLPDRGMDLGHASYRGIPFVFSTPGGPGTAWNHDKVGLEWLRNWGGGLLTGCGFTNVGGPCVGADGELHGLHGRLSNLIGEEVNSRAFWTQDGRYALEVTGLVRQHRMFGENISIRRKITTFYGENKILVEDAIENETTREYPFMFLCHMNFGWPLVSEDAVIETENDQVEGKDDRARSGLGRWQKMEQPEANYVEQVFYHHIRPDAEGFCHAQLSNRKLGFGVKISYREKELPYLIQWKQMGVSEYVIGLEPSNCYPIGQADFAKTGKLRSIAPGEKVSSCIVLELVDL
ncbi:MAG: aldose 1-epimerase family protein [Victivallaceae bacterium]|nr:aldose 1-epimerase family protein [Victivallaceae bacterium]